MVVQELIEDRRFRAYHRELVKPGEFNTFDVLRYADYEIRHSNVLAWLLRPAETHGIGSRFLKWFVNQVNGRLGAGALEPLSEASFEAANVDVWRERDYVDITVRFRRERYWIAVENKTEPASSDHLRQIMDYVKKLEGKHKGHTVKGVLLTTSPDGSVKFPRIAHVGWDSVRKEIGSVLGAGGFPSASVQAFIQQYHDMVERWFVPPAASTFRALLDDHRSILKEMRRALEKDGDAGVQRMVPADRKEYRDTVVRLVRESRHDPKGVRQAVGDWLKGQGCKLHFTHNARQGVYWLNWTNPDLAKIARGLGGGELFLAWGMTFAQSMVRVAFYLYAPRPEEQDPLDRLRDFLQATPINRTRPEKYLVRDNGYGWHRVFDQEILSSDELVEMSAPEARDEAIRRLRDFMGSDDSEYRRIDDYFRCLAFGLDASASTPEDLQ